MANPNSSLIEVAYATPKQQTVIKLNLADGWTIADAIQHSGILRLYPEIDLEAMAVGIFSKRKKFTDKVRAGDRIEIYRPLEMDPKEARRLRAKKNKLRAKKK